MDSPETAIVQKTGGGIITAIDACDNSAQDTERLMSIRILHTADWQIGKRFAFIPGDAGALVREQRFKTIERLIELAATQQVDLALVAGDVFDMNSVEDNTLRRIMNTLGQSEIPWLLLPGNHDPALAESVWTRMERLGQPENVHFLITRNVVEFEELRVSVLGAPLCRRHEATDLTQFFDEVETPKDGYRIGVAHGSVQNRLPERAEATNPIDDTRAKKARLDYLALGDWHGTLEIADKTWYAGTPESDRFKDNDSGFALIVDIDRPGAAPKVKKHPVGKFRWATLEIELLRLEDLEALNASLQTLAKNAENTLVRLKILGSLGLHERQELGALIGDWQARLRFFDVDDSSLRSNASDEDLALLGRSGFVGQAVAELQVICDDETHPDHLCAADALQLLYAEHTSIGGA